ncbi:MAG: nuclear transport factor 2 family protein [Alphaproteobacteria bacterium]|nr:nuclear transport factor 2 family protein [Alphaproteobacteria bacterium]
MEHKRVAEVADAISDLIRSGDPGWPVAHLYAEDAVSVEPYEGFSAPGEPRETRGHDALRAKHRRHDEIGEFVSCEVSPPFFHGEDRFALNLKAVARNRATGQTQTFEEVAVYHLRDGLIVREEFFAM